MIDLLESPYLLRSTTDADLQELAKALWNWEICRACHDGGTCSTSRCSWRRSSRLKPFFDFYKDVTSCYVPELLPGSTPALRSHGDVIKTIRLLRAKRHTKRSELTLEYFSRHDNKQSSPIDQCRAFNLAVQIMSMVKCSAENQPIGLLELGTQPVPWRDDKSLDKFISTALPKVDRSMSGPDDELTKMVDAKTSLTAKKLKKVARLQFRGTDDLRNHLRIDRPKGIVEIYHYTSVLKEHLKATLKVSHDNSLIFSSCASVGNVPRKVALEALDSVQKVLFPFNSGSERILRELVSKQSFDLDCLCYDSSGYRVEGEDDISYSYFGGRLMELYEEVEDPSPRGFLETWLQRKSGARYVMMATLIGVLLAIVIGILGLGVAIFQAWVSYQAWKHPVN